MRHVNMAKRIQSFAATFLCFAIVLCSFSGCGAQEPEKIEYLIGVSQANMRESWRLALTKELKEEAAKHPGVRLIFTDATQNSEKQIADMKRLLDCGVDLLIVSPCDVKKITPVVSKVYQSIPVIVMDRVVEGYDYSLFIGPDNRSIGKQAGKSVIGMLGGSPANVLEICGSENSQMSAERSNGFQSILSQRKDLDIKKISIENESRDSTEDFLLAHKDQLNGIRAIFAHNDYMALGACRAVQRLGLGNIQIIGVDGFTGDNDGIGLVQKGMIDETITCPTGGREAIQYSMDILQKAAGVPKQIILQSHSVTKQNISQYLASLNKVQTAPEKTIRIGYAQVGTESSWRLANTESIQNAAQDFGIQLYYENANQSQVKQIEALRRFIAMKVDVIVLSPVIDSGWDEVLKEAKAAGIPVILSDREITVKDDNLFSTFIGADFVEEGRRAMRWIKDNVSRNHAGLVKIMELQGTVGASPSVERKLGFEEILKECPDYRIVYSQSGDFTYNGGKKIVEEYLKNHKWDINVLFAHNDDMALGAADALTKNGITPGKDVKIISIDGTKKALNAILNGNLNCVVECNPLLGPQLMKAVKDLMSGKELPLRIITDEKVFTKENTSLEIKSRKY